MKSLFSILFLITSFVVLSQKPASSGDASIFGKIIDEKTSQPIEYVAIRLLNVKDSSVISGLFTDVEGKFNFENSMDPLFLRHLLCHPALSNDD